MVTQSMPGFFSLWRHSASPPSARVRPEGADNYAKNRGTLQQVVFEQASSSSSSSKESPTRRPSPRCPTPASKVNYQLGVHGNVGDMLKGITTTSSQISGTTPPRVKPEAAEIATRSQGMRMHTVLQEQNREGSDAQLQPRVKPEGEPIASISKGRRMSSLIHEYGQHDPAPRSPRVKSEAQENANTGKGGRMNSLIHKYGTMPMTSRALPRVKPEGTRYATIGHGSRMGNIIHQYATNQTSPRASARVRPEGETYAQLDQGNRMSLLLYSPTSPDPSTPLPSFPPSSSTRPTPRVKPEASQSADLDRGPRMAKLLYDSHNLPESPRPQSRALGEQAKRNMWRGVFGSVGSCLKQSGRKTCPFLPTGSNREQQQEQNQKKSSRGPRRLSKPCVV